MSDSEVTAALFQLAASVGVWCCGVHIHAAGGFLRVDAGLQEGIEIQTGFVSWGMFRRVDKMEYSKEKKGQDQQKENEQTDFIRETIVKKKSLAAVLEQYVKKPVFGGVLFGITAALVFLLCTALADQIWPDGGNKADPETEIAASESTDEPETTEPETTDEMPHNESQLEEFVSKVVEEGDVKGGDPFYEQIMDTLETVKYSSVTVTAVKKDMDWFAVSYDSSNQESGILVRKTDKVYYILTEYDCVKDADSIQAAFFDGSRAEASLIGYDKVYDIAILSVERSALKEKTDKALNPVHSGTASSLRQGAPAIAVGSPGGSAGTVGIGFISCVNDQLALEDCVIQGVQCSIQTNGEGCSFLLGINGEILGIYTDQSRKIGNGYSEAFGMDHVLISINRICDGETTAGLGLVCQDIEESIRKAYGLPEGIYVLDVKKGSPAYETGVQAGDVISVLGGTAVDSMETYETLLQELPPAQETKLIVYRNSKGAYKSKELKITPTVRQD